MNRLTRLFRELRDRRIVQIVVLYAGGAWVLAQVVGFFVTNYELSRKILDVAVFLLVLGFPTALILGWFHGEKGQQKVSRSEAVLLVLLLLAGGIGTYRIATAEEPARRMDGAGAIVELGQSSVAVVPFRNAMDDPELAWLDRGVAELLSTDLAQLPSLRVVSGQRLADLLRLEGAERTSSLPDELATRVARRAGARFMLSGTVLGSGQQLTLNASLMDLDSGEIVVAAREGGTPDQVFSMVDRISERISHQILEGTEGAARREPGAPVAEITTGSLAAFREYQNGIDALRRYRLDEATEHLERAVQIDSTFALAHLQLAHVASRQGSTAETLRHIGEARAHMSAASERDRLLVEASLAANTGNTGKAKKLLRELVRKYPDEKEARFGLAVLLGRESGRQDEVRELLGEILALDPLYAPAYNRLAYSYARAGEFEAADSVVRQYVELEPDEPNPRDSRGEILEARGRYEEAREAYRTALRLRPSFTPSLQHMVRTYLWEGHTADARRELARYRDSPAPDTRVRGLLLEGDTHVWDGAFERAVARYDTAERLADRENRADLRAEALRSQISAFLHLGRWEELEDASRLLTGLDPRSLDALFGSVIGFGERGMLEEMEERRERVESVLAGAPEVEALTSWVPRAIGILVSFYRGHHERTLEGMRRLRDGGVQPPGDMDGYSEIRSMLALGRAEEALRVARGLDQLPQNRATAPGRPNPFLHQMSLYWRGRAHELLGNREQAARTYRALLERWGEAVREVPLAADAPERLRSLEGSGDG